MKTLGYYKVYDWMLKVGDGFTPCTGLLAYIYSFQELSGEPCKASTKTLAEVCGCKRRKVFKDLAYLLERGFISAQKGARTEIVAYIVNVENCIAYAPDAQDAEELMHAVHKAYAPETQELMHEMHTEYKKIEKKKLRQEERERSGEAAAPPTLDEVSKYFNEIGCSESASVFVDYYSARAWKGIHDWKAAARAWMQRGQRRPDAPAPQRSAPQRSAPQQVRSSSIDLSQIRFDNES